MGGGIKSDAVNQTRDVCLRIGLFNKGLFDKESILTNEMVQERYMLAIEKRSATGRTINGNYWLLKKEKTKAYIIISENSNNLGENPQNIGEHNTNKSKVKKSKENQNSDVPSAVSTATDTKIIFISLILNDGSYYDVTENEVIRYEELYPAVDVKQELRNMAGWSEATPQKRKTKAGIKRFITRWLQATQDKGGKNNYVSGYNQKTSTTRQNAGVFGTGEKVL